MRNLAGSGPARPPGTQDCRLGATCVGLQADCRRLQAVRGAARPRWWWRCRTRRGPIGRGRRGRQRGALSWGRACGAGARAAPPGRGSPPRAAHSRRRLLTCGAWRLCC
eukprot:scaffold106429_cov64-Phaeocystis_antarctica.AAC.4